MGKKKEPSLADSVKYFKEVMNRSGLTDYVYVDRSMLSKNTNGNSILINPDIELWIALIQDPEFKPHLSEFVLSDNNGYSIWSLMKTAMSNENDFIDLDSDILYKGELIEVKVHDSFDYTININRELLPLKLRKSEYNSIKYKVFTFNNIIYMAIKKEFPSDVPDTGFSIIRVLRIV